MCTSFDYWSRGKAESFPECRIWPLTFTPCDLLLRRCCLTTGSQWNLFHYVPYFPVKNPSFISKLVLRCPTFGKIRDTWRRLVQDVAHVVVSPSILPSKVLELFSGATASVALPAHHGRAPLPVQALRQHREHRRRRRQPQLHQPSASLPQPQVSSCQQGVSRRSQRPILLFFFFAIFLLKFNF